MGAGGRKPRPASRYTFWYLPFPFSQAAILGWALWVVHSFGLPPTTLVPICAVGAACIPFDVLLYRAMALAADKEYSESVANALSDQLTAQRTHLDELDEEFEAAKAAFSSMADMLVDVGEGLKRGDHAGARSSFDGRRDALRGQGTAYCAHPVVDALIAAKAPLIEQLGVEPFLRLDVPGDVGVTPQELCCVFSNLLDNAIEALHGVDRRDRGLWVGAAVRAGCLMIEVSNTVDPEQRFERRKAAFGDEHGWGLAIVEMIAARRDGTLQAGVSGGRFVASVAMRVDE